MKVRKPHMLRHKHATIKERGIGEDMQYIYTGHKRAVRERGFELPSDIPLTNKSAFAILIKDGNYIDITEYGSDNNNNNENNNRNSFNEALSRFESSVVRSRSRIAELGFNNPWKYFFTFTLSPEKMTEWGLSRHDLNGVKVKLAKAFNNYRNRRAKDFRYLCIPEPHKDGAVHFHGFLMGVPESDLTINQNGYLDFPYFAERFGWVSIDPLKNREKAAAYITKYVSKSMFSGYDGGKDNNDKDKNDKNGASIDFHKHLYFCSKGLTRDRVIAVGEPVYSAEQLEENLAHEGQEPLVNNEWCFKVVFRDKRFALSLVAPFNNRSESRDIKIDGKLSKKLNDRISVDKGYYQWKKEKHEAAQVKVRASASLTEYDRRKELNRQTRLHNKYITQYREKLKDGGRLTDDELRKVGVEPFVLTNLTDEEIASGFFDLPVEWADVNDISISQLNRAPWLEDVLKVEYVGVLS